MAFSYIILRDFGVGQHKAPPGQHLHQHIAGAMHVAGGTLDHVITHSARLTSCTSIRLASSRTTAWSLAVCQSIAVVHRRQLVWYAARGRLTGLYCDRPLSTAWSTFVSWRHVRWAVHCLRSDAAQHCWSPRSRTRCAVTGAPSVPVVRRWLSWLTAHL